MPPANSLPLGPVAKPGSVLAALALIAIGLLGAFGSTSRWDGLLALPFGPDGVRPLHEALTWGFFIVAWAGCVWLLRRRPLPSGEKTIHSIQIAWLSLRVTVMLLLLSLAATVATRMWLHLGARAAWRGEWWGADGNVGMAWRIFAGLTLCAALSLAFRLRELRGAGAGTPADGGVSTPSGSISRPR